MAVKIYDITEQQLGSTFDGLEMSLSINDSTNITDTTIIAEFHYGDVAGDLAKRVTSEDSGGITKTDAENGLAKVDAFDLNETNGFTKPGTYYYAVMLVDGTRSKIRIAGKMVVTQYGVNKTSAS
jgi:hypothetical protein